MTREEAIERLVALDVAKWGEHERAASRRAHNALSHGRAVNALGARLTLSDNADEARKGSALMAEAKGLYTEKDRRELRRGG